MNQIDLGITSHNSMSINKNIILNSSIQEKSNFYFFPKHIHQSIEIYYFISGSCKMDIGKETVAGDAGSIIIIFPNTVHSFYLDSDIPCKFIHIHFDPYMLSSIFVNKENLNLDLFSILESINNYYKSTADKPMISLLYSIVDEFNNSKQFSEILSTLHLIEVLIYFMRKETITSLFLTYETETTPHYVFLAFKYIKENYFEKILLSDIANYLNISSRYLSKLFYNETNLTVLQYLNIYRINKSIDLMMTTDKSLTDISLSVGLGDIQHFSKLFKNIIGINPRKYKQLLLKQ
ncbi:MAG: AraC family transcriptional regulator [Clostridium sp.]|jgi:AraC-like DNA-binding protein/mannose-6-phosphate isomerase-like protein (cupin superfamily)|uniref:helix-turn-helix domain-containing protein n=1 Tax=Clostridium TaxID=1485 RepID=UPI002903F479|nr:AraC family transcriptional regulator [Clostridium sp.]MBS6500931.1 helix-turn-helix transcriptional regulator [Clostridium sp.]MDU1278134.1 AraC family transcriptional regulator [Clostridium sp.]MDU2459334.1 AraC family transcriptional regulator [Clostridium sp.]MDU3349703.1 AraC family transcriptional regulator [Clostridium sp.]MDU3407644.1 AraC family transcriptional regulator [Clostridium sp.]